MKFSFFLICIFSGITSLSQLSFSNLGSDPAYCRLFSYQNGNGVVYAAATGGSPSYTYEWVNLQNMSTTSNSVWGGLNPGDYKITITDSNSDVIIDTVTVDSINVVPAFDIVSSDFNSQGVALGPYASLQLVNNSTGFANPNNPNADTIFFWNLDFDNGAWIISNDINDPIYKTYTQGEHTICLIPLNKNGCNDTLCKNIFVFGPASIDDITTTGFFNLTPANQTSLSYSLGEVKYGTLKIFDLQGKLIDEISLTNQSGTIEFNQNKGLYLYELIDQETNLMVFTGKFIF